MTDKIKSTAPVSSVGADGEQPKTKNHTEIIANENVKNNLQATNCPEKSGQGGGLQTVSMTELYDTVYPPRTPVVDDFLYGGTLSLCGCAKSGEIVLYGAACLSCGNGASAMELSRPKRDGIIPCTGR